MRTAVWNPSLAPSIKVSYTLIFLRIPAMIKQAIIPQRRTLAKVDDTTSICSRGIVLKPQIMRPTNVQRAPRKSNNVRLRRLIRWYRQVTTSPTMVEKKVAKSMGTNTSVGCAAPIWARYTKTLIGTSVNPEVLSTRNMIMGFVAVSFSLLSSCNCSIALSPIGVAALSSPNILAAKFIKIVPVTGCPLGISGKIFENTGANHLATTLTTPPFSPMRIMPSHKESTPVRPSDTSKAVLADEKVEFMIAGNTSVSPKKTRRTNATAKATRKKAIQI